MQEYYKIDVYKPLTEAKSKFNMIVTMLGGAVKIRWLTIFGKETARQARKEEGTEMVAPGKTDAVFTKCLKLWGSGFSYQIGSLKPSGDIPENVTKVSY